MVYAENDVVVIPANVFYSVVILVVLLAIIDIIKVVVIRKTMYCESMPENKEKQKIKRKGGRKKRTQEVITQLESFKTENPPTILTTDKEKTEDFPIDSNRPAILKRTTVTTQQYIAILYTMIMQMAIPRTRLNMNNDVAMLQPGIPLSKIINFLDVRSFLRFSATCTHLREICTKSTDIKLNSNMFSIEFTTGYANYFSISIKAMLPSFKKVEIYGPTLERIKQLPIVFLFSLRGTSGSTLTNFQWISIQQFLDTFKSYKVPAIHIGNIGDINWTSTINAITRFQVKEVGLFTEVPAASLSTILKLNLKKLSIQGNILVKNLENIIIPSITIYDLLLSLADVEMVLQLFQQKKLSIGSLCFDLSTFGQQELVAFLSNHYTTITSFHEGELPTTRPLVVSHQEFDDWGHHWLLTEENDILEFVCMGIGESFIFSTTRYDMEFFPHFLYKFRIN